MNNLLKSNSYYNCDFKGKGTNPGKYMGHLIGQVNQQLHNSIILLSQNRPTFLKPSFRETKTRFVRSVGVVRR